MKVISEKSSFLSSYIRVDYKNKIQTTFMNVNNVDITEEVIEFDFDNNKNGVPIIINKKDIDKIYMVIYV